jgi:error-prone DNA polymerase
MTHLALADRDGLYGAPRFDKSAREEKVKPILGADLAIAGGHRLLVLIRDRTGYRNLSRLITAMKLTHSKEDARAGRACVTMAKVAEHAAGLLCLTGGEDGEVPMLLSRGDEEAANQALGRLREIFGTDGVWAELQSHLCAGEDRRNRAVLQLASRHAIPPCATNDVAYATPELVELYDVLTCIRAGTTLDQAGRLLERNAERHLKSAVEMSHLFCDLPQAITATRAVAERCAFTLEDLGYEFPDYPLPDGQSGDAAAVSHLRALAFDGAVQRFTPFGERERRQLERELTLIDKLKLAGYFLIVHEIVDYCRTHGILVQGRGSAANSALCFALGITAVDPIKRELLFERFLSEERGEWPDIDLDLPSGDHREEVIQHVYERYGRHGAAMTAEVITYRGPSAVRDVGKTLGFSPEEVDRMSKQLGRFEFRDAHDDLGARLPAAGLSVEDPKVLTLLRLCREIQGLPRHLSQHSGGMVIAKGRLDDVVPLEPATMPGRVVVQWDKDDCADLGLIKIDLLGLGMMAALEECLALVRSHDGVALDLAHLPTEDPAVYDLLCRADTVGVFQVESRAQMATLPRMKPRHFYDLVVEVALIRPGPIVGRLAHPYLRRRAGREVITYAHESLRPVLERTLGVPLFQEQILRMAMVAAGFTGGEAEELRRAIGFKRSTVRMEKIVDRLRTGMAARGIAPPAADQIAEGITAFAMYGFPESHAASFALLVYASAYLKVHHPACFFAALLNAYPMGFYHPSVLVKDAQQCSVQVLPLDVSQSHWRCTIEGNALRLGLRYVHGFREDHAQRVVNERRKASFASIGDLGERGGLTHAELTTLAELGALGSIKDAPTRRTALWQVEAAVHAAGGLWSRGTVDDGPSPLPEMSEPEMLASDYRASGMTTGRHPIALYRDSLTTAGVVTARELSRLPDGAPVRVAGTVIVRQRPGTAKGFFFLTLEDETGFANAIVTPNRFEANRAILVGSAALIVIGHLQHLDGVRSVKAVQFEPLSGLPTQPSHDFH